ncbi:MULTISPECIES: SDR family NAD(P)-dependent oxidoreductase [Pseudomonas]|uniref:SDR family NAD(P)-dependent oxidoreductase n=1 Tax=Pseudomonas neustonica TaxID=2487346 RepID=A0ABX9XM47_9PSED|nr:MULTISPECIES: SDR family NAD(P)-dependent oxidoreductase [Pseudomonas]MAB26008.1 short-chain dehydrogenase [Pseudomonadales bacterium]MBA6421073.1 SDR family NAD(P)-dependent oxidoreductase [Pseudomonas sp. 5Ae-yellow]ROZ82781.1 SDR family NAD(P)-dependent oxidoreductase [Pseudomonas sp. SSM44]ROZ84733.1 SDR family NAD(P)-dependent oxidoreductase [Pseudomonas neustonica]|tara:strand:+ start:1711 stop:2439 length:729 start_codon:yes stop_codon:yes gene_type:complete
MPSNQTIEKAPGRRALVIGASRGIGLGFVSVLLARGWQVTATVRDVSCVPYALSEVGHHYGDRLAIAALDMKLPEQVSALAALMPDKTLDLLVISAGILGPDHQRVEQATDAEITELFDINAMAPLRLARALLPAIKHGGVIGFVSSRMGSVSLNDGEGLELYRASKAALNSLSRGFAVKQALPAGVGVLNLHPGWVQSDMGGSYAPVTVEQSATGMVAVLEGALGLSEQRFVDFEGNTLSW